MRRLLSFPHPVNEVAVRTVGAGVLLMSLTALVFRQHWLLVPLAFGFIARVLSGPRFSPLGRIATQVVAPRMPERRKLLPGPPKRFSQGIGAVLSTTALMLWLAGTGELAVSLLLAMLVLASGLESILGFCLGCQIFAGLMRIGVIPESVCLECANIWQRYG